MKLSKPIALLLLPMLFCSTCFAKDIKGKKNKSSSKSSNKVLELYNIKFEDIPTKSDIDSEKNLSRYQLHYKDKKYMNIKTEVSVDYVKSLEE